MAKKDNDLLLLKIHTKSLVRSVIADKEQRKAAENLLDILFGIYGKP